MDIKTAESLGLEDLGKWLPFVFHMEIIDAAKLSSDEEDSPTFNCTTIFTKNGDTFIIDTTPTDFFKKFIEYNTLTFPGEDDTTLGSSDLDL
jgi:hypothetical protein